MQLIILMYEKESTSAVSGKASANDKIMTTTTV
jgi:hypothetical protein